MEKKKELTEVLVLLHKFGSMEVKTSFLETGYKDDVCINYPTTKDGWVCSSSRNNWLVDNSLPIKFSPPKYGAFNEIGWL